MFQIIEVGGGNHFIKCALRTSETGRKILPGPAPDSRFHVETPVVWPSVKPPSVQVLAASLSRLVRVELKHRAHHNSALVPNAEAKR
ncbi:MAG: hypothetical protein IPJ18_20275 [Betaproteobacteria bacterium]|nr:hypothetical protein [Betaproteobacteria bacterium]